MATQHQRAGDTNRNEARSTYSEYEYRGPPKYSEKSAKYLQESVAQFLTNQSNQTVNAGPRQGQVNGLNTTVSHNDDNDDNNGNKNDFLNPTNARSTGFNTSLDANRSGSMTLNDVNGSVHRPNDDGGKMSTDHSAQNGWKESKEGS